VLIIEYLFFLSYPRIQVASLIAIAVIATLGALRIKLKRPASAKEWLWHIIVPIFMSTIAALALNLLNNPLVLVAHVTYMAGVVWLMVVVFSELNFGVSTATPAKAFLDISRAIDQKIEVTGKLFASWFAFQNDLDLSKIKELLSEYETRVQNDLEKYEQLTNKLVDRLFEIADNCRAIRGEGNPVLKQVCSILETEIGILPMKIVVGKDVFDSKKHEIKAFEYRDDLPEWTITKVLRDGYSNANDGTLARVAFVKVAKHKKAGDK
jgi:hypothetical protein